MRYHLSVLLLIFLTNQVQSQLLRPSWAGLWRENPKKSNIFVPGTLRIAREPDGAYVLVAFGGQRTALDCIPRRSSKQSCVYLTAPQPSGDRDPKIGVEYRVNAAGTNLKVDSWRIVPDGTRLTDTDYYSRSTPDHGFAGRWRKTHSTEAPTVYSISIQGDRMTFAVPNGELSISFSVTEARTATGALAALGPQRTNCYKLLGPSKVLEQSLLESRVTAQSVITLSADGQTMTEDHTGMGQSPNHIHIVYDRER